MFIEDIYGYTWMSRFQKIYENVYIPLPKPGPRLRIPHVASLSVIKRHIAPITIPNNEMYEYVASNLDFSETYKEKAAELNTGIEDVEKKLKKVLQVNWYDKYVRYLIYGALIAISIIVLTVIVKIMKCLNVCERRPQRNRPEGENIEMQPVLHDIGHRPSLVCVADV